MNKAYPRVMGQAGMPRNGNSPSDPDDDAMEPAARLPEGVKNYITPQGYRALQKELDHLWKIDRPELVKTISWAASNGDRSENGDYIYGKKRLREIDRRVRFLRKRIESSEVVDPARRAGCDQVFFGATVTVSDAGGIENTYTIVGVDEADVAAGRISWVSPLARALLKLREGEVAMLQSPAGINELEVTGIVYCELE